MRKVNIVGYFSNQRRTRRNEKSRVRVEAGKPDQTKVASILNKQEKLELNVETVRHSPQKSEFRGLVSPDGGGGGCRRVGLIVFFLLDSSLRVGQLQSYIYVPWADSHRGGSLNGYLPSLHCLR